MAYSKESTMKTEMPIALLHDLASINGARVEKYQRMKEGWGKMEVDLSGILSAMTQESKRYQEELTEKIGEMDGISLRTRQPGDIFQLWSEEQAPLPPRDKDTFLAFCEQEEQALQHAYQTVMIGTSLPDDLLSLLEEHHSNLENGLDELHRYRSAQ